MPRNWSRELNTNIDLYIAFTKTPIPHLGEMTEAEFYKILISRALDLRFLVLEASLNPMPYLGVYLKESLHLGLT